MKKKTVVFVFNSLGVVRGGLSNAVLKRANTLVKYNIDVIILTLSFQPEFVGVVNKLYERGNLDKKIKVLNFFNDILGEGGGKRKKEDVINEKGFYVFKGGNPDINGYRYYKDGFYVKYKQYDKSGNLMFVDYMNEARHRYQRDEYNKKGEMIRSRHMDQNNNLPRLDRYFNSDGECAITIWVDGKGNAKRVISFDKKNQGEYAQLEGLYNLWIKEILSGVSSPVVISDSRNTDSLVAGLKSDNIKKVAVLHNNHFKSPFDNTAEINKLWNPFFDNINEFDRIVFLTEEQKEDVERQYGPLKASTVIPHAVPHIEKSQLEKDVKRNPYLVVTLARYKKQKRLDEAIEAFSYVVEELPDAQYHIYGFGDLQEDLETLIQKLNLTNNVKLIGFTSDPIKTYRSAACSILTSDFEGFGLVLTESLAAGTPVISYDIKYGPKDIVRNEVDGYLVPKGNKKELAEKIITLMTNNQLREEFSNNALEVTERFSIDKYEEQWLDLIDKI
ncbi:glycosyltransferase [Gracilibacillus timonensis]|uniref:glycosyltransferase n=1 Tax=Gracilibacillus timonensis TaxID=1816696 RepID=UPI000825076E|nr:glycosyltransferase [Gracilibacillus timonensis]